MLRGGGRSRPGPGPRRAPPWWAARRSCGSASCPAAASWWRCAGPGEARRGAPCPGRCRAAGRGLLPPAGPGRAGLLPRRRAASCEQRRGRGPGAAPGLPRGSRVTLARLPPAAPGKPRLGCGHRSCLQLSWRCTRARGAFSPPAFGYWGQALPVPGAGGLSREAQGCETQPGIGAFLRSPGADRRGQL